MVINKNLAEEIYNNVDDNKIREAKKYIDDGRVNITKTDYQNQNNFSIKAIVEDDFGEFEVNIDVKEGKIDAISCDCDAYKAYSCVCEHIAAVLLKFEKTKFWENDYKETLNIVNTQRKTDKFKYKSFTNLINTLYNEELEKLNSDDIVKLADKDKIKIETKIIYDKFTNEMKLEFKIGKNRMYKIKNLPEFYTKVVNNEYVKYGEKLEFVHNKQNFEKDSQDILDFILRYAEVMKYSNSSDRYGYNYVSTANKSVIILGENAMDEVFDILKNKKVNFTYDCINTYMEFIEENPKIEFELSKVNDNELILKPNIDVFKIAILNGNKYVYLLNENKLFRCNKDFSDSVLKVIFAYRENYTSEMVFPKEELKDFYSIIMPKIGNLVKIQGMLDKEIEAYKPQELAVKVFLDFDENNYLVADIKFCYGEEEFNPLQEKIEVKASRNELQENRALSRFKKSGFMLDVNNLRLILPNDDNIYEFLTQDINLYMQKFEVLVTDNFKTKEIKTPKIGTIGVKVENNLLNIDLSKLNVSKEEIQEVMEKYRQKKKFHRLKDGTFIDLSQSEDVEFLDKLSSGMGIDYKDLNSSSIKLPVNRTLYLNELLKKFNNTKINKNTEYKQIVDNLEKDDLNDEIELPDCMKGVLRDYQYTGYTWLKTLDDYKLGGILADDMGLGKTIQVLAMILDYVEKHQGCRKTSIVISPSSLALNWLAEVKKFTPSLNIKVISGMSSERNKIISELEKYDLVITSYDLLKRDINLYKEKNYNFKYIIADEAQYLKNYNTQNAKTIKSLNGETRFALTGTPIENSLSELWSIFDYIMPGYLFQYKRFKNLYELPIVKDDSEETMSSLKMLIEPFILRRTKSEVLSELPAKTITVLNNTMEKEQEKIYMSYLVKAKQEVANEINIRGFEKSQIAILTALTRLRQICCHPKLFIDGYDGESSKLIQCMEIIENAINAGHRILLFSGYTSMFEIIQKELEKRNIRYFKLTGATKVSDRIASVDEFNQKPDIKIFLISLKAGGTGLNLTGADVVIHYDPWWNGAVENQATDRAYRIGQKNNVQVYKLITSNSIEEKIYELQQKKAELIDGVLSNKVSFISKLTKEEIMKLFE